MKRVFISFCFLVLCLFGFYKLAMCTVAQLDTENADVNLTSFVTVLTYNDSSNHHVKGMILLGDGVNNLGGDGGSYQIRIQQAGIISDAYTKTFPAETRTVVWTDDFIHAANLGTQIQVKSPYGCDSNVDVTAYLYDLNQQTGDSYAIVNSGTYGNAQLVRSTTPANTLDITASGNAGIDWGNVGNESATVNLSATTVNLVNTLTTYTGNTPQTGDAYYIVNNDSYGNAKLVRSTTPANTLTVDSSNRAYSDTRAWNGTTIPAVYTAGYPIVTIKDGTGTGEINTASGIADSNLVNIAGAAVSTTTAQLGVNVVQISGDATSADNAELDYDGTGYNKSNSTIGNISKMGGKTISNDSQMIGVNVTNISGDATAANNLELDYDGTGFVKNDSKIALTGAGIDSIHDESYGATSNNLTLRQLIRLISSVLHAKVSGGGTTTITYRDLNDSKDAIVGVVDANGNRTSVTRDGD